MKTRIILAVIVLSALLTACTSDRDENFSSKEVEDKKVKISNKDHTNKAKTDTINVNTTNLNQSSPESNLPVDGGDPTTITPPKR